jgi:hypothetical protein
MVGDNRFRQSGRPLDTSFGTDYVAKRGTVICNFDYGDSHTQMRDRGSLPILTAVYSAVQGSCYLLTADKQGTKANHVSQSLNPDFELARIVTVHNPHCPPFHWLHTTGHQW